MFSLVSLNTNAGLKLSENAEVVLTVSAVTAFVAAGFAFTQWGGRSFSPPAAGYIAAGVSLLFVFDVIRYTRIHYRNREEEGRIRFAMQTLTQDMREIRWTVSTVNDLPFYERAGVIRHARRLITQDMGDHDVSNIVYAVAAVRAHEREEVISHALQLITPGMRTLGRTNIVMAVSIVPSNEREEIVRRFAPQLITPGMTDYERYHIVTTLAACPILERENIVENALQLITPHMDGISKVGILIAVTAVPILERNDIILHALQLITPEMYGLDIQMTIQNIAAVPAHQRANYVQERREGRNAAHLFQNEQAAAAAGINVHEGNRDLRVRAALELLRQHQGVIEKDRIDRAVKEFTQYVQDRYMYNEHKQLVLHALLGPRGVENFGPLIGEADFSIVGLMISGEEVLGRLWIFASALPKEPHDDQSIAKESMIAALKDSYEMGSRVCNGGKTQRLVVGVLQGRLHGVDIENLRINVTVPLSDAIEMFFNNEELRNTDIKLATLIAAAKQFCDENPRVDRAQFIRAINEYAAGEDIKD